MTRMHTLGWWLVLAFAVGWPLQPTAGAQEAPVLGHGAVGHAVGEFFPDVELPTIGGEETIRLSSYRGRRLLLIEFASW